MERYLREAIAFMVMWVSETLEVSLFEAQIVVIVVLLVLCLIVLTWAYARIFGRS